MIKEFEGELLKVLDWNVMLTTAYDYAHMFRTQGFVFSNDTINGKYVSNHPDVGKRANALLDAILEKLPHNPDFYQFYQSEVAMASILHVWRALNLDEVCSDTMLTYMTSDDLDLPIIFQIETLLQHCFPHVMEASSAVPLSMSSSQAEPQASKIVNWPTSWLQFDVKSELRKLWGTKCSHFMIEWPVHWVKVPAAVALHRQCFKTPRIMPYADEFDMSSEDSSIQATSSGGLDQVDTSADGGSAKDVLAQLLMGDNKPK